MRKRRRGFPYRLQNRAAIHCFFAHNVLYWRLSEYGRSGLPCRPGKNGGIFALKLLALDANSLLNRAFYAIRPLSTMATN